jgi:hypothetical protein
MARGRVRVWPGSTISCPDAICVAHVANIKKLCAFFHSQVPGCDALTLLFGADGTRTASVGVTRAPPTVWHREGYPLNSLVAVTTLAAEPFRTNVTRANATCAAALAAWRRRGTAGIQQSSDTLGKRNPPFCTMYHSSGVAAHDAWLSRCAGGLADLAAATTREPAPRKGNVWVSLSPRTVTATHYDMSDNFIAGVAGIKRFVLFPPHAVDDALHVYPSLHPWATKSQVMREDVDSMRRWPMYSRSAALGARVALLHPGEVLYIPPMWSHHVSTVSNSTGVADDESDDASRTEGVKVWSFSVNVWTEGDQTTGMCSRSVFFFFFFFFFLSFFLIFLKTTNCQLLPPHSRECAAGQRDPNDTGGGH